MTHRNAPEKHQYPDSAVIFSEDWNWQKERAISEAFRDKSNITQIVERILAGDIIESNLADCIDPYIYSENKKLIDNMFDFYRKSQLKNHDRNMTVIYIFGEKGTGKTTLAKRFCDNKELTYFISGGSNDPLEGYSGEEVIILDDARPDTFTAEEWLKLLDNNTNSMVRSRYHNKMISAQYIILTSTIPLLHFFRIFPKEDPQQLFRRIKLYFQITSKHLTVWEYRTETGKYKKIEELCNPIKDIYPDSNLSLEKKQDILDGFLSEKEENPFDYTDSTF